MIYVFAVYGAACAAAGIYSLLTNRKNAGLLLTLHGLAVCGTVVFAAVRA
jgi:hypothetical protein